jgi:hypothetical protein
MRTHTVILRRSETTCFPTKGCRLLRVRDDADSRNDVLQSLADFRTGRRVGDLFVEMSIVTTDLCVKLCADAKSPEVVLRVTVLSENDLDRLLEQDARVEHLEGRIDALGEALARQADLLRQAPK